MSPPANRATEGPTHEEGDVGALYLSSMSRIRQLVLEAAPESSQTFVSACPGWRIRDVVAHLVGVIEDAAAGRLDGPPDEALTAEQVERHARVPIAELIEHWSALAPPFADSLTRYKIWPALLDVVSHEHDIRTALHLPGQRKSAAVMLSAGRLASSVASPVRILIVGEDDERATDETSGAAGSMFVVRASAYEVLRFRLGRRSIDQVRALDWSRDPAPILERLFVFGPASSPLLESAPCAKRVERANRR